MRAGLVSFFFPPVILGSASQPIHKIVSTSSLSFYYDSEFIRFCRLRFSLSDSFFLSVLCQGAVLHGKRRDFSPGCCASGKHA